MILAARVCAAALVALALFPACRSNDPLRVRNIQLGSSLNPDNSVATHTTRFKPTDTIYTAILTDAAGSGTLGARWYYAGRLISEPARRVSYKGPAATEFHIQNSGGFPAGQYRVEILLNGEAIGTRDFRVER